MSLVWPEGDTDRPTPIAAPQISEVSGCTTAVAQRAAAELGEIKMVARWCEQDGNKKLWHQFAPLAVLGRKNKTYSWQIESKCFFTFEWMDFSLASKLSVHPDHGAGCDCAAETAVWNQTKHHEHEVVENPGTNAGIRSTCERKKRCLCALRWRLWLYFISCQGLKNALIPFLPSLSPFGWEVAPLQKAKWLGQLATSSWLETWKLPQNNFLF